MHDDVVEGCVEGAFPACLPACLTGIALFTTPSDGCEAADITGGATVASGAAAVATAAMWGAGYSKQIIYHKRLHRGGLKAILTSKS